MQQWMQVQGVSDRPVRAGPSPAGKFFLYINHWPQPSAVKTIPALDSVVKSKQNHCFDVPLVDKRKVGDTKLLRQHCLPGLKVKDHHFSEVETSELLWSLLLSMQWVSG